MLIEPATERILRISPEDVILDAACGARRFTWRMAALGDQVVAFDLSARFIERARERTPTGANTEGIVGQPEPQYYLHRSLQMLFQACFDVGFVIDGIEEPVSPTQASRGLGFGGMVCLRSRQSWSFERSWKSDWRMCPVACAPASRSCYQSPWALCFIAPTFNSRSLRDHTRPSNRRRTQPGPRPEAVAF
jgi:hypothetical protein